MLIAPICNTPKSKIFHSVLLLVVITAILSPGLIPNFSNPRLMAFPLAINSSVEVATHSPLYLVLKALGKLKCFSW